MNHETERIEFKEIWRDDTALKTLAAFANTNGGTLLIGIDDKQRIVGWIGDHRQLEALTSKIVNNLRSQPSSIRVEESQGVQVLIIEMPSASMPVAYHGHYYRRIGNTTQEISAEELGYFLMQRARFTWDSLPGLFNLDDLDVEQVRNFTRLAKQRLPQITESEDTISILRKLRLLVDEQPTNAAILLFGKTSPKQWQRPQVHMGRFKDNVTILDDKMISGSLFEQLEQIMQIFSQYLQVRYEIPKQMEVKTGIDALQRNEVWEYPLPALREAVVNALIHRDYTSQADIHIRVYDNKIIISNPGQLPEGLTIADLKKDEHDSIPRNPLLAQIFYYASLVERWGTGTSRILRACREYGLPEPEFAAEGNRFSITFFQNPYTRERLGALGLTERQITIIHYIQEYGQITNREYREQTGLSDESARQELGELIKLGILEIKGKGRGTNYIMARLGDLGD